MTTWLAAAALVAAVLVFGRRRGGRRLAELARSEIPAARAPADRLIPARAGWPLAIAVGTGLAAMRIAPADLVVVIVVAGTGRLAWLRREREQVRSSRRSAVVEVTFALAGELRAGRSPAEAIASVVTVSGPLRPVLAAAHAAVAVGGQASDELARAAGLPGAEGLRHMAAAWRVTEAAGGQVADVLDRLGDAMDSAEEFRDELEGALAGPRATIAVLAGLPLVGLGLGQAMGAHPLRLLLHQPLGWALLGTATLLDAAGFVATRAIVRWATRA